MLQQYRKEAAARAALGAPPLPLTDAQTRELAELLTQGHEESEVLLHLLANRVEPGVSKAARVKAAWLEQAAMGEAAVDGFPPEAAIGLLAQMGDRKSVV